MPPLLTTTNAKLGKGKLLSFSISIGPEKSCVDTTDWCRTACYARKGHYLYRNVKHSLERRFEETKSENFVRDMITEIQGHKLSTVRIHAAGDFYSEEYISKWVEIVEACPDREFFVYTRAWRNEGRLAALEELRSLPNIQVFASLDQETPEDPPEGWRIAYVRPDHKRDPSYEAITKLNQIKALPCPEQLNKKASCADCGYCFRGQRGNVSFKAH